MQTLSERLKALRKTLNLNVADFAKKTDILYQNIGNIESEKAKPGQDMLEKIAVATNVRLDWLLLGKGEMFENGITPQISPIPIKVKEVKEVRAVVGNEIVDVGFWQKLLISAEDKVRILSDEVAFLRKQNEYLIAK